MKTTFLAGSAARSSPSQPSTKVSTAAASFDVRHPPFSSAFAKASSNFCSAFARQAGSTALPFLKATPQHFTLAVSFLAAACCFFSVHFVAGSVAASAGSTDEPGKGAKDREGASAANEAARVLMIIPPGARFTGEFRF
jgi:hypothetical protein